jgi:hypothetical protein
VPGALVQAQDRQQVAQSAEAGQRDVQSVGSILPEARRQRLTRPGRDRAIMLESSGHDDPVALLLHLDKFDGLAAGALDHDRTCVAELIGLL